MVATKTKCPSPATRAQMLAEQDKDFLLHSTFCPTCQAEVKRLQQLLELSNELTWKKPDPDLFARIQGAMLQPQISKPFWRWQYLAAALLLIGLGIGSGYLHMAPAADRVAQVTAQFGARFEHKRLPHMETIHLLEGIIEIEVDPLVPGQRFMVVTADSEVEVKGTLFQVQVLEGSLVSVKVSHGLVVIRWRDKPPIQLEANTSWVTPLLNDPVLNASVLNDPVLNDPVLNEPVPEQAWSSEPENATAMTSQQVVAIGDAKQKAKSAAHKPVPTEQPKHNPVIAAVEKSTLQKEQAALAVRAISSVTPREPVAIDAEKRGTGLELEIVPSPDGEDLAEVRTPALPQKLPEPEKMQAEIQQRAEGYLQLGFRAMAAGNFEEASFQFSSGEQLSPSADIGEQLSYWNASALARAKRTMAAKAAFLRYIYEYPDAPKVGHANAELGWIFYSVCDIESAARYFARAHSSSTRATKASAKRGLLLIAEFNCSAKSQQ